MAQNSLCLGYNRPTSTALDDVRLLPNTSMPCNPFLHANFSTSFRGIGKPIGESNVVKRRQVVVPRAASGSTAHSVREFVLKDFRARRALKVCVSAVEPESFLVAVEAGAHMVEIGNYDSFYEARRKFSSTEILHLTKRTRHLLPSVIMSVTVPHTLTLADQVRLAELLEIEGTDIIQTEGGASSEPSRSGVHGLIEKVTMVLNEALRLYTPAVMLLRHTYKEMKLGNFTIPANTRLLLPIIALHHDPKLWGEDVYEFKPERFAEGAAKAAKHPLAFIPFGLGPRTCVGQNFAMLEAKVALAMILQQFSFSLSPSYAHAPTQVLTLQPQHGAQMILHQLLNE